MKKNELETHFPFPEEVINVISEVLDTGRSTVLLEYQNPKMILIS